MRNAASVQNDIQNYVGIQVNIEKINCSVLNVSVCNECSYNYVRSDKYKKIRIKFR